MQGRLELGCALWLAAGAFWLQMLLLKLREMLFAPVLPSHPHKMHPSLKALVPGAMTMGAIATHLHCLM